MKKTRSSALFRYFAAGLCLCLAVYFLLPMSVGILHIGMLYPAALLVLAAAAFVFAPRLRRFFARRRVLAWLLAGAAALGAAALLIPFCAMLAASRSPKEEAHPVCIVLGCQVRGTEPSLMLAARCKAAFAYLTEHPEAVCIASGGQGGGEAIPEAEAIRNYLTARGIGDERIFPEDSSVNTFENIRNSAALIRSEGLPTQVTVVTDGFHQLRAAIFCRSLGLEPQACSCRTMAVLAPGYWAREILAVYKALVFGR